MAQPLRAAPPQIHKVGARSCRSCHQRKVRCDRGVPCTNCSRGGVTCVYPTRDKDVAQKDITLRNISNRLERLETLLSGFAECSQSTIESSAGGSNGEPRTQIQAQSRANVPAIRPANRLANGSTWELLLNEERVVGHANNSVFGIIPQDGGKLHTTQPADSEPTLLHLRKSPKAHQALPTETDAGDAFEMVSSVLNFFPDTQLALRLWNVYVESVDPVLKILHIPTVQTVVLATILEPRSAQSSTMALTFAIYYAAVTAIYHNHEPVHLPCDGPTLLRRYKLCLDRLLNVNDLMMRPELTSLQALAVYVTCLRAHEISRRVWVLNGLAIRLAKSIDLHLDGGCLQLRPFETEMRLRLWWHLCVLESRAPEDQGFQPTIDIMNPGLRLPLNVNDDQIYPDMTVFPLESDGWTDMSFFLIQTESCRLIHPILDPREKHFADALSTISEKRKFLQQRSQYLSTKYSQTKTHLSRVTVQHRAAARKKMEFVLQLQEEISMRQQPWAQDDATPGVLKPSFELACDGLESNCALLKEALASRFKWFFNLYTPWYGLAYVLRCLCSIPVGFNADRAWGLVDELFPRATSLHAHLVGIQDEHGHGRIWACVSLLRHQALSLRLHSQLGVETANAEIQSSRSGEQRLSQLHPDTGIPPPTITMAAAHAASTMPELGEERLTDADQIMLPSLDLAMPDLSLLPDWNAVLNGRLHDDGHEINGSCHTNHPTGSSQF